MRPDGSRFRAHRGVWQQRGTAGEADLAVTRNECEDSDMMDLNRSKDASPEPAPSFDAHRRKGRASGRLGASALSLVIAVAAASAWSLPARAEWPLFGSDPSAAKASTSPVRVFRLVGVARERPSPWDLFGTGKSLVLPELLLAIAAEGRQPEVKTLVMKVGALGIGLAQAEELAAALEAVRKPASGSAKKRVIAYVESADLPTLVALSKVDELWIAPEGSLYLPGLQAEVSFYKDLLGTLGLEADIEAVGQFKSAMEPFTRQSMSDAARENLESLVDGLYQSLVSALAARPGLNADKVKAAIDLGLFDGEAALKAGLVDKIGYWGEALDAQVKRDGAGTLAWPKATETPDISSIFDLVKLFSGGDEKVSTTPKIAVLVAEGAIVEGRDPSDFMNDESVIASEDFLDALYAVENDPQVKAIVLRINSPGGSALASDILWRELDRVGKKLPLVVSMGSVAASGGYYIASAGKRIYADATTLTGSIGVFGGKMVYKGLLDKVGVHSVTIARGKNAGLFSGLTRFSDSEREVLKKTMRHTYETFVNRVAKGRNMSFDAVDKIAQGRVWTGKQALEVGLVDRLGGLDEAIREAARMAKAWKPGEVPEVETFPKSKSIFELFDKGSGGAKRLELGGMLALAKGLPGPLAAPASRLARVVASLLGGREQVFALLPFELSVR
jgi:protease-4